MTRFLLGRLPLALLLLLLCPIDAIAQFLYAEPFRINTIPFLLP